MMPEPMKAPKFIDIIDADKENDALVLTFVSEEQTKYRVALADNLWGPVADLLQHARSVDLPNQELLTTTLLGSQPLATPERRALKLRTQELDSIAFEVNDEMIQSLQEHLSHLALAKPGGTRH